MLNSQQNFVGKTMLAVCEQQEENTYILRNEYNSPNIDTVIYVESKKPLTIGEFYKIKITGLYGIDLKGEII